MVDLLENRRSREDQRKCVVCNRSTSVYKLIVDEKPCLLLRTWLNVKCNSRYVTSTMSNKVIIKLGGKYEPGQPKGKGPR